MPSTTWRSEWQTPLHTVRTSTSSDRSSARSTSSIVSGSWALWNSAAFIVFSFSRILARRASLTDRVPLRHMARSMTLADDRFAVIETLDRYAVALDARDWALLDRVFAPDATADFTGIHCASRAEIRRLIERMLGGCGATQHLLGVYRIEVSGDEATSTCNV